MIRLDRGEDAVVVTPPRDQGGAYNCFAQTASCLTESWMWKHRDKKNKNIKIEDLEMSATTSTIDGLLYGVNRVANITKQDELHKFNVNGGGSVCDVVNAVSKRGSYCPRSANIYESKIKSKDEKSPDNDSKNYQKTVLEFIQNILNVHKNLTNASADTNDEFSVKRAEEARKTLSMLKNMYIQLVEEIAKGKTESEIKIQLKKELEKINSSHQCADCAISNQSEKTLISQVDSLIKVSEQLNGEGESGEIFKNFIRTMAEKDPYNALPELIRAISAPSCLDQKNEIKIDPKPFCKEYVFSKFSEPLDYKDSRKLTEQYFYYQKIAKNKYQQLKVKNISEQEFVNNFMKEKYGNYQEKFFNSPQEKVFLEHMPVTSKIYNSDNIAKSLRDKIIPSITSKDKMPVGIGFCAGVLYDRWIDTRGRVANCPVKDGHGPHAATIIGIRPNKSGLGCQYLFRNSFSYRDNMGKYDEVNKRKVCGQWTEYDKRKEYSVQKSKTPQQIQAERDILDCDNGNLWIDESALLSNTYSLSVMTQGNFKTKEKVRDYLDQNF